MLEHKTEQGAQDIAVSVYCLAYNHENYIRDALEGFVSQKTTFRYEVLVHDDASTDGTADIIREYAERYPDIIRPIYQTENQYSKGIYVTREVIWPRMRGRYVAICEGDDYWTDPEKLQLQYETMEQHPECSICSHYVRMINEETGSLKGYFPGRKFGIGEGILDKTVQMDASLNTVFHVTSVFLRRTVYDRYMGDTPEYARMMPVGDVPLQLFFAKYGQMYFIDREMSVYREGTSGSWTQRIERQREKAILHHEKMRTALVSCKAFYGGEYSEMFDKRLCGCDLEILQLKGGYRALLKVLPKVRYYGGLKMSVKVVACALCPFAEKAWNALGIIREKHRK